MNGNEYQLANQVAIKQEVNDNDDEEMIGNEFPQLPNQVAIKQEENEDEEIMYGNEDNQQLIQVQTNDEAAADMMGGGEYQQQPATTPSKDEMAAIFAMCKNSHWTSCLQCLKTNPLIGVTTMVMTNNISTSVLHQAITSKGDTKQRAKVIFHVLEKTPNAASIRNGYGSLPLHVICQRNTKIDAKTKENLITSLINAYPAALSEQGGVGKRTPLHIIFTDYVSPKLTKLMIRKGDKAMFMRDKNGYLPVHVAASRHCSPEKLEMLLEAYPMSIFCKTNDGKTLIDLAKKTATKSHPNYALIAALKKKMQESNGFEREESAQDYFPTRVSSDDTADTLSTPQPKTATKRAKRSGTRTRSCGSVAVKQEQEEFEDPADLLLHFSRNSYSPSKRFKATQYAEV